MNNTHRRQKETTAYHIYTMAAMLPTKAITSMCCTIYITVLSLLHPIYPLFLTSFLTIAPNFSICLAIPPYSSPFPLFLPRYSSFLSIHLCPSSFILISPYSYRVLDIPPYYSLCIPIPPSLTPFLTIPPHSHILPTFPALFACACLSHPTH